MKNILRNKHTWIIFAVFTLLAIAAYIWLPNNINLRTMLLSVAISHLAIAVLFLITAWFITPKKIKEQIKKIRSQLFKSIRSLS